MKHDLGVRVPAHPNPKGLAAALRSQRQVDEDGTEVAVSRQAADAAATIIEELARGVPAWDASQIKQPGWNHVQQAFIDGAREARVSPEATEEDFGRASDGYTKRVFEEVDPASEEALRTGSWKPTHESGVSEALVPPCQCAVHERSCGQKCSRNPAGVKGLDDGR
jgi:hypothetical protein